MQQVVHVQPQHTVLVRDTNGEVGITSSSTNTCIESVSSSSLSSFPLLATSDTYNNLNNNNSHTTYTHISSTTTIATTTNIRLPSTETSFDEKNNHRKFQETIQEIPVKPPLVLGKGTSEQFVMCLRNINESETTNTSNSTSNNISKNNSSDNNTNPNPNPNITMNITMNRNLKNPSLDPPDSPSTISTKPSSSLLLTRVTPITKESNHHSTEEHHKTSDGAESCSSPQPQHRNQQQQPTPGSSSSSILRKTRFSPEAANTIVSPRPCTGHRVKGLWSPSVEIFDEDHHRPTVSPLHRIPTLPPLTASSPGVSPMETMRDETLSKIFCYLPLADLLRAGMVSRQWRHEIHKTGNGYSGDNDCIRGTQGPNGNWETETTCSGANKPIHLWEKVDATTFIQERYESFLGIAKERKLSEQQQQQRELELQAEELQPAQARQDQAQNKHPESIPSTTIGKKKRNGTTRKKKTITDPCSWARIQTGLALGRILRTKTTRASNKREGATQPFAIRSLVLRNIGDKLSSDNLDDFLPSSLLSSLRELTLEGFDSLTDTHVHVLLLTTLGCSNPFHKSNKMMMHPKNKSRSGKSKLEALALENCPRLTSKVLSSVAKTCSHERLVRLSVKGCVNIDSIASLSDLLITKLVLPSNTKAPPSKSPLLDPPDLTATQASTPSLSLGPLFAPEAVRIGKRSISSSLFAPAPSAPKPAGGFASLFAPPPQRNAPTQTKPHGVASLFAPPPPPTEQKLPKPEEGDAFTNKQPKPAEMGSPPQPKIIQTGVASLFVPPLQQSRDAVAKTTPAGVGRPLSQQHVPSSNRVVGGYSSSSSSPPSKSSLASLFDLPGTSPTRLNNAESIRILPPMANLPSQTTSSPKFPSPCSNRSVGSTSATKRYHRHQRSLSNGKLPFPSALLGDAHKMLHTDSRDATIQPTSVNIHCRSMVVGSLRALDIRGTAVTPSSLVDCLRALTHYNHSGADQSWCRVWFEALHLSSAVETPSQTDETNENHLGLLSHPWTLEDLVHLESLMAMDEMQRNDPSVGNSSREGVSYSALAASPR